MSCDGNTRALPCLRKGTTSPTSCEESLTLFCLAIWIRYHLVRARVHLCAKA